METKTIKTKPVTPNNITGYGTYLCLEQQLPAAEMPEFSFWNKLAVLDHRSASIGMVWAEQQEQMISTVFEQHLYTTEMLIPTDSPVVLVLAEPQKSDATQIDFDTVQAFTLNPGDAVVLNKATWHFAPHAVERSTRIWVVFEEDTPDNDLFIRHADEEAGVRYLIE